ncbi:MAG: FAD-dependent monooxygenase, partial [Chlamydiota bacterium]
AILLARSGVKVTLLEQDTQLDRGFRGPAYQPSAIRIWEEMGILEDILALDHNKVSHFTFLENGKELITMDVSALPPPFNYILIMKQAHLLRCFIKQAACYPNFTYLGGVKATGLISQKDGVKGVTANIDGKEIILHSRLVVAADGRFSGVRQSAEIPLELINQNFDVIWFELPHDMESEMELGFHMTEHGFLVFLPKEKDTLQIGLVLGKGGYPEVRKKGFNVFIEQITAVEPSLRSVINNHLTSWDQCELLDVKMGIAERWCKNGMVLIGDSAHIASPIGGIGNKLAIEDAAIIHPLIIRALKKSTGIVKAKMVEEFEKNRRPDIKTSLSFQKTAGKIIMGIKSPFLKKLRSFIAPKMKNTPLYKKVRQLIAWSPHDVHVDKKIFKEYFVNPKQLFHKLTITDIHQETPSTKSFTLAIPEHLKELFQYQAGQFVTIRDLVNGVLLKRCYSISVPEGEELLRITVKHQDGGLFSNYLHNNVKVGDKLLVSAPTGGFVASEEQEKHFIFFSGGSGITPIYSLINTLLQRSSDLTISLFNVNKIEQESIFHGELLKLSNQHPNFHIQDIYTEPNGRPDKQFIEKWLSEVATVSQQAKEYYLCGPHSLMETIQCILKIEKIPSKQIHIESFFSAKGIQEMTKTPSEDISGSLETGNPSMPKDVPRKVVIEQNGEATELILEEGETILDACLRNGINVPFSCQEGICGTCKACLIDGRVVMDKHEALSEDDIASNKILTCRAVPQTEICKVTYKKE